MSEESSYLISARVSIINIDFPSGPLRNIAACVSVSDRQGVLGRAVASDHGDVPHRGDVSGRGEVSDQGGVSDGGSVSALTDR
jgi:hypothetical protein